MLGPGDAKRTGTTPALSTLTNGEAEGSTKFDSVWTFDQKYAQVVQRRSPTKNHSFLEEPALELVWSDGLAFLSDRTE